MISSHFLGQLISSLKDCSHRNNLLRAAILDFFVALHALKCQKLIDELVPKYREEMAKLSSVHEVFLRLIQLYDSGYIVEGESQTFKEENSKIVAGSQHKPLSWDSDIAEEDYFSENNETADVDMEMPSLAVDATEVDINFPPIRKKEDGQEEEFGGALGGPTKTTLPVDPSPPAKKNSLFSLKNSLKSGFGLWKITPNGSTDASTTTEDASADGSPSKKTKTS